ncbi:MAG: hypothetical protein GY772_13635, partial [bacterium]|nr:hypothetical protein [bacterium]
MLGRLAAPAQQQAISALAGQDFPLYVQPHDHEARAALPWPDRAALDRLHRAVTTSVTHIVLGPGEYLHINKGRLHAFRKLLPGDGPEFDDNTPLMTGLSPDMCVSIAWDWQYGGESRRAVRDEAMFAITSAGANSVQRADSLGVPRIALMETLERKLGDLRVSLMHLQQEHSACRRGGRGSGGIGACAAAAAAAAAEHSAADALRHAQCSV